MAKKVKAIFKGQDGSCGYNTNMEYTLTVRHRIQNVEPYIEIQRLDGSGYCDYESIESFLNNWDNIRNI